MTTLYEFLIGVVASGLLNMGAGYYFGRKKGRKQGAQVAANALKQYAAGAFDGDEGGKEEGNKGFQ